MNSALLGTDPTGLDHAGLVAHVAQLGGVLRGVQAALVRSST